MLVERMAPRILILTASVGEGHDAPTRTLSRQLRSECPEVEIMVEDGLEYLGRIVHLLSARAASVVFFRMEWLWDLGFWVFAGFGPTRRVSQALIERLGTKGMLDLVARCEPDVIVSLYPHTTEVLGRLRQSGRLHVPLIAGITDLAALRYWATPGADVHLITHPESVAEVHAIAGEKAEVHCVQGFTDPAFLEPRSRDAARAALSLPEEGRIVVVSGGGWGVGRVHAAIDVCLAIPDVALVVCLCGRNEQLRAGVSRLHGEDPRVRVEGFTDEMPDWLAAADVLIHSTGGLTMLEALMRHCPAISYGWGRGHVRVNNAAYRHFGLVPVAESDAELAVEIRKALDDPHVDTFDFAALPSAASFVLARAGRQSAEASGESVLSRR
jgi:processive 1,2-diacylglycerol beta-glucosyltransferase